MKKVILTAILVGILLGILYSCVTLDTTLDLHNSMTVQVNREYTVYVRQMACNSKIEWSTESFTVVKEGDCNLELEVTNYWRARLLGEKVQIRIYKKEEG